MKSKLFLIVMLFIFVFQVGAQSESHLPDYSVSKIILSGDGTKLIVLGGLTQGITHEETLFHVDILDASTLEWITTYDILFSFVPYRFDANPQATQFIYSAEYDQYLFDTADQSVIQIAHSAPASVGEVDWNPHDDRVARIDASAIFVTDFSDLSGVLLGGDVEGCSGLPSNAIWSTDGSLLATTRYDRLDETTCIFIWDEEQLLSEDSVQMTPARVIHDTGNTVFWSPSDRQIASFTTSSEITIYDTETATANSSIELPSETWWSLVWSPDETQIAVSTRKGIVVFDVETGEIVEVFEIESATSLVWLPDIGIVHDGLGEGLYLNGERVTEPLN
ncbi:MAG: hypothetical protein RLP44_22320 [Aggregatilineales bacterium]